MDMRWSGFQAGGSGQSGREGIVAVTIHGL
jgi:hypothetical protein